MKKFFSLFCALAMVLSVSAAPVKKAHAAKFAMEQAKEVKAQKSLNIEKTTVAPAAQKAPAKAVKPQAVAQPKFMVAEKASFTKAQNAKVAKAKKAA